MKQAIIWLAEPLKAAEKVIEVVAVDLDQNDNIIHSAGALNLLSAHSLVCENGVAHHLWLVDSLDSFHDLRGQ